MVSDELEAEEADGEELEVPAPEADPFKASATETIDISL